MKDISNIKELIHQDLINFIDELLNTYEGCRKNGLTEEQTAQHIRKKSKALINKIEKPEPH